MDDLLRGPVRPQHGRPAQALTSHRLASVLVAAAALGGCGGGDDEGTPASGTEGEAGEGGALVWAIERQPRTLDPLLAEGRSAQLVTRQIHEPLIERLAAPFDDPARTPGLAVSAQPSSDATIWRLRLRGGIRFQDGVQFDAGAVLANAERWQALPQGAELLPGLFEVDAPRPDLVRFLLSQSDPNFDQRLASPRLGIVSPRALRGDAGGTLAGRPGTGTGAFELREREPGRLLLARNTGWWGTRRDLGPALDQLEFLNVADPEERVEALLDGEVELADRIRAFGVRKVRADPLLSALPAGRGRWLGLERSVRGIDSGREIPSLQGAWLTTIGP